MDWESRYFVRVDPGRNVDKHWQITRKGTRVLRQWGRRGSGVQQAIKTFGTVFKASEEMVKAVEEKMSKGYLASNDSLPLPAEFEKHGKPVDTREGYFLTWETTRSLDAGDIDKAVDITRRVLWQIEPDVPVSLAVASRQNVMAWGAGKGTTSLSFQVDDTKVGHFGFVPDGVFAAMGETEREQMRVKGISRDGWLACNGAGSGVIETQRGWGDFPVRLFLSVLAANAGVSVSDVDDQPYGEHGFRFSAVDHRDFAWRDFWELVLKPAIQAHWMIEGGGVLIGRPSLEESPFAW